MKKVLGAVIVVALVVGCGGANRGPLVDGGGLSVPPADGERTADVQGYGPLDTGVADTGVALGDSSSGELLAPARTCTDSTQVFRCLVHGLVGSPGVMECQCQCSAPDEPLSREMCDPAVFSCCGWGADEGVCYCSNQEYRDHFDMADCAAYLAVKSQYFGAKELVAGCP